MKKFTKEALAEMAKAYAESNPKKDKIYATNDGNFFFDKNSATNHSESSSLKLYKFKLMSDVDAKALEESESAAAEKQRQADEQAAKERAELDAKEAAAAKAKAETRIMEMDLSKIEDVDYREAGHLLRVLNLTAESGKKVDVVAALANLQKELLKSKDTE